MEREEAERAELRKMILGQSEKKPQINQNDQQQSSSQGIYFDIIFFDTHWICEYTFSMIISLQDCVVLI